MLKAADEAIYSRRNAAVEQERAIKENELKTEIAVETRSVKSVKHKWRLNGPCWRKSARLIKSSSEGRIGLEQRRATLVDQTTANSRKGRPMRKPMPCPA